jgi:hypothetical protein
VAKEITIPTHEKKIIKHPSKSKCFIMKKMPTSSSVAFLRDERRQKEKRRRICKVAKISLKKAERNSCIFTHESERERKK